MRTILYSLLAMSLAQSAAICAAEEAPEPEKAGADKLAQIAAQFNEMFVHGKAIACVIGSAENSGTTTYYYPTPYRLEADGSYTTKAVYSVVTRTAGQKPTVQHGEQTERLRLEAGKPVIEFVYPNRTSTPQDLAVLGNGITISLRRPPQGEMSGLEWLRERDGSVIGIQRYMGLEAVVDWKEVDVPPELQQMTMAMDR